MTPAENTRVWRKARRAAWKGTPGVHAAVPGTPAAALEALGAVWSPDLSAYAAGRLDASQVRCVLCGRAPCACPPFGTPEYLAMVDRLHGRARGGDR
jgi:hypothetical protein